jgi:hypothetical protein
MNASSIVSYIWSSAMSTLIDAKPTTVLSMVQTTPAGDRPYNPGLVQEAQRLGVLDATDATKLGAMIQENPQGVILNYGHAIFGAIAFSKDEEKTIATQPKPVTGEHDLWTYIERMVEKAQAAGLVFTVTLDANGQMVPVVQKAAPAASA